MRISIRTLPSNRTRVRFSYYSIWINMLEHTSRRILVVFSFSIKKPLALCSWSSHYEADEYYSHMSTHSWFKYINKSLVASRCSLLRSCDMINSSVAVTCMVWMNPNARRHTITSRMNLSESAKIKLWPSQQTTARERLKKSALMNSTLIDGWTNANINFFIVDEYHGLYIRVDSSSNLS